MAVTAALYGTWPAFCMGNVDAAAAPTAVINLKTASNCKVALTTNSYSPNQSTNLVFGDVTNEVTGTAYVAGGTVLVTPSLTYASRVTKFDADDVAWAASTITARRAVLYYDGGSTDRLISWVDFGGDVSSSSGAFTISWASGGILTVTVGTLA